ncbi:hypothetical protein, partial [Vulcanococcus sp.]|uniref:hypothetical protein n=1 Tax=Vulcanococcus sp. TaxID=2856995 RepID=UPI003C00ED59
GTIVTLAGGSKIQDSEDFSLNKYTPPTLRWDNSIARGSCNNATPLVNGAGDYMLGACWTSYFLYLSPTATNGTWGPDDWPSTFDYTTQQIWILTDTATEWLPVTVNSAPSYTTERGWYFGLQSYPSLGTFSWIQVLPYEGSGFLDIALEVGDAVVWDSSPSHGLAFRPRSFKAHQLLDIETPALTFDGNVLQWSEADQLYKHQALAFNISAAADYTGAAPNLGEVLTWDGAKWDAQALGGGLAINDLTDVNTATVAPLDGQALVWSQANGYWRPGEVASGANALDDLTDVTITSPAAGKVIRYNGTAWVDAVLSYQDLSNKPTLVTTLAGLTDTDLSLAPTQGQVLTWDGSAWAPADPTGGGAGGSVAGALTERADETQATASIADGVTAALAFVGLGVSGNFTQVTTSAAAWVRFYPTDADRIADSTRDIGTDPAPGSGVLLEVITTAAGETVKVTPSASYFNNDDPADPFLYCAVRNLSGATATVSVTVRAYSQVIASLVSGGTFGSG